MKSVFIPAVLILCMGCNSNLFPYESKDPSLGGRGLFLSMGVSNFGGLGSSPSNNKFIPAVTLGFYQDFPLESNMDLELGLMFSSKGSRLDAVGDLYLHQFIMYLEFPVRAIWTFFEKDKAQIFLSGGTNFGIKLLAFNELGFPEEIRGFDVGLELGVGMNFKKLSFRLVANQGFLNLDQSNSGFTYKNQSFLMAVGVKF